MQSLSQARRKNAGAGEPIFFPILGLKKEDIHLRRGQVTMIAAAPGGGKTALTHACLFHGDGKGNHNRVLYLSADSGAEVIHERAACLATGMDVTAVRKRTQEGRTAEIEGAIAARGGHMRFDFTGYLSEEHINRELSAYVELEGEYPEVVVVDNLKNAVDQMDADETRAGEDAVVFLNNLARNTGAAVIILTHVLGEYEAGDRAIPLSGIRNKLSKTPAVVLTLHRPESNLVRVSVVKNRNGRADATGKFFVPLNVDLARMRFTG